MHKRKGFTLISAIFFMTAAMLLATFAVRIVVSQNDMAGDDALRLKAFWAAEGGIEWAKANLSGNPSWFTDLPHSPADDSDWLISGAAGEDVKISDIRVKIVREEGKNLIYAVGYVGDEIASSKALSIIKVKFTVLPFEQVSWASL